MSLQEKKNHFCEYLLSHLSSAAGGKSWLIPYTLLELHTGSKSQPLTLCQHSLAKSGHTRVQVLWPTESSETKSAHLKMAFVLRKLCHFIQLSLSASKSLMRGNWRSKLQTMFAECNLCHTCDCRYSCYSVLHPKQLLPSPDIKLSSSGSVHLRLYSTKLLPKEGLSCTSIRHVKNTTASYQLMGPGLPPVLPRDARMPQGALATDPSLLADARNANPMVRPQSPSREHPGDWQSLHTPPEHHFALEIDFLFFILKHHKREAGGYHSPLPQLKSPTAELKCF